MATVPNEILFVSNRGEGWLSTCCSRSAGLTFSGVMAKEALRELIGTFHIGPKLSGLGQIHYLRTKDGNHWLLDVKPERVYWLDGLEVVVKGRSSGSRIEVTSIAQA